MCRSQKLKKKANFCTSKVASMRLEQQELEARDLAEVAAKFSSGRCSIMHYEFYSIIPL